MLYKLLYDARTAARKKGLITNGRKVFVRFSKKYFNIRDGKKRSYSHLMPLHLQVFFPQKNGKESGSYRLGYLIKVLFELGRQEKVYDFQYTPKILELTGSGFFIKLNSVEYRIEHHIKIVWDHMEKGDTVHLDPCNPNSWHARQWLNEQKPQLRIKLEKLKKELKEL